MLQRHLAPALQPFPPLRFPSYSHFYLDNGIEVYGIPAATFPLFSIELVFAAARRHEPAPQVASFCNSLLDDGTVRYSAFDISEAVEQWGCQLSTTDGYDYSSITLNGLSQHFERVLPLLQHLVCEAVFPETELVLLQNKELQSLQIRKSDSDYIASQWLQSMVLGGSTPYGYLTRAADIKALHREQLLHFYQTHYTPARCTIFVAGAVPAHWQQLLNQTFGSDNWGKPDQPVFDEKAYPTYTKYRPQQKQKHLSASPQCSIVWGMPTIRQQHPDSNALFFANTILGGFFGSRLMMRLREQKGYTYGIYTQISYFLNAAYWSLSAETGNAVTPKALKEINVVIQRFLDKPPPKKEMEMVRNYILGNSLHWIDGVFNSLNTLRNNVLNGFEPTNELANFEYDIQTISAKRIQEVAQLYLQPQNMSQIIVGGVKDITNI